VAGVVDWALTTCVVDIELLLEAGAAPVPAAVVAVDALTAGAGVLLVLGVPAPAVLEVPAPEVVGVPAPAVLGVPEPAVLGVPEPAVVEVPAPAVLGVPEPAVVELESTEPVTSAPAEAGAALITVSGAPAVASRAEKMINCDFEIILKK